MLLVPGEFFDPDGKPSSYVRASFSTATDSEMVKLMSSVVLIHNRMKH